jgi:hypothetical protein
VQHLHRPRHVQQHHAVTYDDDHVTFTLILGCILEGEFAGIRAIRAG